MIAPLSPPPRRLPLSLAICNVCGPGSQIGWFVFGFGMIFVWAFAGHADYSFIDFVGAKQQTIARIENSWRTGASQNKQRIYANEYSFIVNDRKFHGVSFGETFYRPGDSARVEYLASKPEKSRIEGMRRGEFSAFVMFVAIFPLIGIAIVAFAWQRGATENRLLQRGILTTGALKENVITNVRVNNLPVHKLTFEFIARDGKTYKAESFTSHPERLTDEAKEPLLYDPDDPTNSYMLDEAPSRPKLDGTGELIGRPVAAFSRLIVPAIVLIGNGFGVWLRLH